MSSDVLLRAGNSVEVIIMSNTESILSHYLTREELAIELGRNARTLDRWDVLGIGPPRTLVGRKILYRRMSVQRWLTAQENQGRSDKAAGEGSSNRALRGAL